MPVRFIGGGPGTDRGLIDTYYVAYCLVHGVAYACARDHWCGRTD